MTIPPKKKGAKSMHERGPSKRSISLRSIVMFFVAGIVVFAGSCAPLHHGAGTMFTKEDVKRIHPGSVATLRHHHLAEEESLRINGRLNRSATSPGDLIAYYDVKPQSKRPIGEFGKVFVERVTTPEGDLEIIVSVHNRIVQKIEVKNEKGTYAFPPEFLNQFVGRRLDQSFEVGTSPEDFHRIPAPLIPLTGNMELSRMIADAVYKSLVISNSLGL
jgi:hypothetical protein